MIIYTEDAKLWVLYETCNNLIIQQLVIENVFKFDTSDFRQSKIRINA